MSSEELQREIDKWKDLYQVKVKEKSSLTVDLNRAKLEKERMQDDHTRALKDKETLISHMQDKIKSELALADMTGYVRGMKEASSTPSSSKGISMSLAELTDGGF